ncbi:platelet-derived growth factor receptor alpha-like [Dendronephthya gigantea]|uniref:platelet-derived growth factor receptor alpha-like n=1 Tax=Dendronephthya gigantea TaxID=151771 RepID=UPI001068F584|nr:platelet-derived growth factor receptor alpha-like [Dendronephthya gigantea]
MISDIGIVGQFLETEKSITNLAPEVLEDLRNRTKAADVYSYGIVLWEMWYGAHAFREFMPIEKVQFREKLVEGYRPEMDNNKINIPKIHGVMVASWATEVEKRWSMKVCYDALSDVTEWRLE